VNSDTKKNKNSKKNFYQNNQIFYLPLLVFLIITPNRQIKHCPQIKVVKANVHKGSWNSFENKIFNKINFLSNKVVVVEDVVVVDWYKREENETSA